MRRIALCATIIAVAACLVGPTGVAAAAPRPAPKPDLAVTSVVPQSTVQRVMPLTVKVTVRNSGRAVAKASTVRVLLSADATRSRTDRSIGVISLPAILPSKSVTRSLTIRSFTAVNAPSSWRVLACTDDLRKVAEASETNNCRTATVKLSVTAPPAPTPPKPPAPTPTPPTPPAPTFPITVTAQQVGAEGSSSTSSTRVIRFTLTSAGAGRAYYRTDSGTATEGADFLDTDSSVLLVANTPKTVDVKVVGDTIREPIESLSFVIHKATLGLADTAVITAGEIADDDVPTLNDAIPASRTSLVLTYNTPVDASTVNANGSQFTISPTLAVTAAAVSGNQVTLTTAQQVGDVEYTVTQAAGVKDAYGGAFGAWTADFTGNGPLADLLISEVNFDLTTDDRLELYAVTGGSVAGLSVRVGIPGGAGYRVSNTLPSIEVAAGDVIVLHENVTGAGTNVTETTSKTQCTNAGCYSGAWDVVNAGASNTANANDGTVIYIEDQYGDVWDSISVYKPTVTSDSSWLTAIDEIQMWEEWDATCAAYPCTYAEAMAISIDWSGLDTTPPGISLQRNANADTNLKGDWVKRASSWGVTNT